MPRRLCAWILPFLLAQPLSAATGAERQAWVLASDGGGAEGYADASADAVAVSRRLMAAGFSVTRRENADPASLRLTDRVAPLVFLYFSGPIAQYEGETWLLSGLAPEAAADAPPQGWPLSQTVRALREAGAVQVIAVVEGCHQPGPGFAALPEAAPVATSLTAEATDPPPAPYPQDVVFLLSAAPGQPCPAADATETRLTDHLIEVLARPGEDFLAAFDRGKGGAFMEARLAHSLPPLVPPLPAGTNANDLLRSLPPEEAARLGAAWGSVASTDMELLPAGSGAGSTEAEPALASAADSGLSLIAVSASARIAARPTQEGLPRPSVIVGEIGLASDVPAAGADPTAETLRSMSREDRLAMREADAASFDTLVQSGAFDPAPADLVPALQTELSAARCYSGTIDGQWGPGSRGGVTAFFAQRQTPAPSATPDLVLYRAMLAGAPVTCPAPLASAPRTSGSGGTAPRNSGNRPAASGNSAPAASAPAGERKIDAGSVGLAIR